MFLRRAYRRLRPRESPPEWECEAANCDFAGEGYWSLNGGFHRMLFCVDMLSMGIAFVGLVAVEARAARTAHHRIRDLRGHPFAALRHGIFLGRPVTLTAILEEVSFRASREIVFPSDFEIRSRLIEAGRVAGA
jgi:hypothetical protein